MKLLTFLAVARVIYMSNYGARFSIEFYTLYAYHGHQKRDQKCGQNATKNAAKNAQECPMRFQRTRKAIKGSVKTHTNALPNRA